MAAAQGVGTEKSNNLLVVEAHLVENIARVLAIRSGSVGETAIGGRLGLLAIDTSSSPVDNGTTLENLRETMEMRVSIKTTYEKCADGNK